MQRKGLAVSEQSTELKQNEAIKKISRTKFAAMARNFVRQKKHLNAFKKQPQTASNLFIPSELQKYAKLVDAINTISNNENGPFIIGPIIHHFTTIENFKNIIKQNAMLGNQSLKEAKIEFSANCISDQILLSNDKRNLDGNVICFCPGGFVDFLAITSSDNCNLREGLIRLSIDARKIALDGKFNMFFKAIDLCLSSGRDGRSKTPPDIIIKLTHKLSVHVNNKDARLNIEFCFGLDHKFEASFDESDLIFYGNLQEINQFSLILPFIALSKCVDKDFKDAVYHELEILPKKSLISILIYLAQNITSYSEFNINGRLPMQGAHLITSIHDANLQESYNLSELSEEKYSNALHQVAYNSAPLSEIFSQCKISEKICYIKKSDSTEERDSLMINGQAVAKRLGYSIYHKSAFRFIMVSDFGELDLTKEATINLGSGYVETRWKENRYLLKKNEKPLQDESGNDIVSAYQTGFLIFKESSKEKASVKEVEEKPKESQYPFKFCNIL